MDKSFVKKIRLFIKTAQNFEKIQILNIDYNIDS